MATTIERKISGQKYRVLSRYDAATGDKTWDLLSFETAASDVLFDDGTTLEDFEDAIRSGGSKELTQIEYDALSTEEKNNGTTYFITDAQSGGGSVDGTTVRFNNSTHKLDVYYNGVLAGSIAV